MLSREHLREYAQTSCDIYNIRYFDGVLRYEIIVENRSRVNAYAFVIVDGDRDRKVDGKVTPRIFLNPALATATVKEIEEILAHELVHVAQCILGIKAGHGKEFRDLVQQFGIPTESGKRCITTVRHPKELLRAAVRRGR